MVARPPADGPARKRRAVPVLAVVAAAVAAVLVAAPLALLWAVDAGLLNGLVRHAFEAQLHRKVVFGALKADLLAREPRLVLTDVRVAEPPGFGADDFARARTLDLTLRLGPLLAGRFDAPTIRIEGLELRLKRRGPGDANWILGAKGGAGASGFLAGTRRLEIGPGRVSMDDPQRALTLSGEMSNDPDDPRLPLHLQGGGMLKGADYQIVARAAPLNARPASAPWAFRATLVDGATRIDMDGAAWRPFDFDRLDMRMIAQGPNLADLHYLFGFTPLNSRPYALAARLRLDDKGLRAEGLRGRLGDTDVEGALSARSVGGRRRLSGRLSSQVLTATDLQILLATPPPRLVARSQPGVAGKATPSAGRLFSTAPFSLSRLGAEDIVLDYAARSTRGFGLAAADARAHLGIERSRLTLAPLSFTAAGGRVRAELRLDPGRPHPTVGLKLDARDLALGGLTHGAGGVGGRLDATVDARGSGASLADAAADAQGRAGFRLQRGALPKLDAEALGGNLFGLIGAKLGSSRSRTGLRCAAGDFDIAGGVVTARRLVVATDAGAAVGGGRIDLGRETVALELRPAAVGPKPAVRLDAPITISGPLLHPKVGASLSRARLDFGGLFGALAHPFRSRPPPPAQPASDKGC